MPIQHAIWKVGDKPTRLSRGRLVSEQKLEEMIVRDPEILSSEWMLIGRQEITSHGGRIDLLAIAPDGALVLVELKRERTPREIVAQALDYASWVEQLTPDKIAQIYQRFSSGGSLDEAFHERFGTALDEDTLNESHQIVIVASELDAATERIIDYLNERDIAINVLFFQVFQNGADQLLSRAWLIDCVTDNRRRACGPTTAARPPTINRPSSNSGNRRRHQAGGAARVTSWAEVSRIMGRAACAWCPVDCKRRARSSSAGLGF